MHNKITVLLITIMITDIRIISVYKRERYRVNSIWYRLTPLKCIRTIVNSKGLSLWFLISTSNFSWIIIVFLILPLSAGKWNIAVWRWRSDAWKVWWPARGGGTGRYRHALGRSRQSSTHCEPYWPLRTLKRQGTIYCITLNKIPWIPLCVWVNNTVNYM